MMENNIAFLEIPCEKVAIDEGELLRRLCGDKEYLGRLEETRRTVLSVASVKCVAREALLAINEDTVDIGGVKINSVGLARHLGTSKRAVVIALSLGIELDRYIRRCEAISVSLGFAADAYASALADGACLTAVTELLGNTHHTAPFAVGYADSNVSSLQALAEITDAPRRLGLSFSSSNLMIPTKSIIVIVGKM